MGWIAVAVLAVGATIAIGVVALGVVASGGLLALILVGAGVGVFAGIGSNIYTQGGLSNIGNINPWSVFLSGVIGGIIGAASGAASYGFSQVGQYIGQKIGLVLGNATHLGTGINISKQFGISVANLISVGSSLVGAAGGTFGGMLANDCVNIIAQEVFGEQYSVDNPNYVRSILLKMFKWLNSII